MQVQVVEKSQLDIQISKHSNIIIEGDCVDDAVEA